MTVSRGGESQNRAITSLSAVASASRMLAEAADVATVSRVLGHSSAAVTSRAYAFILDAAQAAVAALGAGLAARIPAARCYPTAIPGLEVGAP